MDFGPGQHELTKLTDTRDHTLLQNTKLRFQANHIYTRSGRLLLALNPYQKLHIYDSETKDQYKKSLHPQAELPPHVYDVAAAAHMGLLQNRISQTVVISGESGAGKTETAKILLSYLADVSSTEGSQLHQRVLQTNPIMESFGCAKTAWNNNSSRFGKFLTLQFSASGRMEGASLQTYLLEKSRVTMQLEGEQNYHVFYLIAKGLGSSARKGMGFGADALHSFKLLNAEKKNSIDFGLFPTSYDTLCEAMDTIPALCKSKLSCWKIIMVVLYLGNLQFKGNSSDDAEFSDRKALATVASALGCQVEQLSKAICTTNIKAGLDWISKPNTSEVADSVRKALAKALYSKLFEFVVSGINSSLAIGDGHESRYFIGAVDIFGFESFPLNSLEQLCINFANEKLQRIFTSAVFESVLEEYEREGIAVGELHYEHNVSVIELIEAPGTGLLPLLSEECFFPNGSDASWLEKIKQAHSSNECFGADRREPSKFTIKHYPGPVTYTSHSFLEKNKDPLSQDLVILMQFSDDPFVADLFKDKGDSAAGQRRFKSAKFIGVIDNFRQSLNELVSTLNKTHSHFIRCIKPNLDKRPNNFVDDVTMRQLHSSGVVQAVAASRQGFPDYLPFAEVLSRFSIVLPKGSKVSTGASGVKALLTAAKVDEARWRIGKTRVFLGVGVLDTLEYERMQFIASKAISMQIIVRGFIARKQLERLRDERRQREEELRRADEARRLAEEEARRLAEEIALKKAEEEKRQKAIEEKGRQERFQRARQQSFERGKARKKRLEGEARKKEEEEARAKEQESLGVAAAEQVSAMSEEFAQKLELFQQQVADGTVDSSSDMMNVAVVSDIGWKGESEPAPVEENWAQYDFKCAASDVLEYAENLGMDIHADSHLLWIADEALQAPEPQGWEQRLDPKGGVYYYHPTTGMSLSQHPLDHHYQQFYLQMKSQYDAMQSTHGAQPSKQTGGAAGGDVNAGGARRFVQYVSPPSASGGSKRRPSFFGKKAPPAPPKGEEVEECFEFQVHLDRQQDGLGVGLTLDNIIVEIEQGGSVAMQGDLHYGDQIVAVDGNALVVDGSVRMLKDIIVPRRTHALIVHYSRSSNAVVSPRRKRARKIVSTGSASRRMEEMTVTIKRETSTGKLGFSIDASNTVVEVDPRGSVAHTLHVGDKIISVNDKKLDNTVHFVDLCGPQPTQELRIARLRTNAVLTTTQDKREKLLKEAKKAHRLSAGGNATTPTQRKSIASAKSPASVSALREVKLVKDADDSKIGAVFHRSDDAFDKTFFNVETGLVQPIIKKVDPGSMAEEGGLVAGDVVLSVNGVSGLSNFEVVDMLRRQRGEFNLVVQQSVRIQNVKA